MFTGIVEEVGRVEELKDGRLAVRAERVMEGMKLGDSMAVNGACLTVVDFQPKLFAVELSPETLRRTSLGELEVEHPLNLERPLAVNDRLGGHIVQGHVDATGRITSRKPEGDSVILRVRAPKRFIPYIVEKGFIAVDGISLTVVQRAQQQFTISVIPFTMQNTNLKERTVGDLVNLEADILAKYVESLLNAKAV
jgi:riboflavin synthase